MKFRNGIANTLIAALTILIVFVLVSPGAAKSGTGHAPTQVLAETKQKVLETYGNLPLRFEANQGQADRQVKFLSRGRGSTLFLTSTEAVLTLGNQQGTETVGSHQPGARPAREEKASVLRMKLAGSNPQPRVVGLEELPGKVNYFIGNDPAK